jgi:hypothetical protein
MQAIQSPSASLLIKTTMRLASLVNCRIMLMSHTAVVFPHGIIASLYHRKHHTITPSHHHMVSMCVDLRNDTKASLDTHRQYPPSKGGLFVSAVKAVAIAVVSSSIVSNTILNYLV